MKRFVRISMVAAGLIGAVSLFATGTPEATTAGASPEGNAGASAGFPVSRVALFTSGVGYFEHAATVSGTEELSLSVPSEEVSDLLKSLVVEDRDGGTVRGVTYATSEPLGRALDALSINIRDNPPLATLLTRLRGERVELRVMSTGGAQPSGRSASSGNGGTAGDIESVRGTIAGVETKPGTDESPSSHYVNLITGEGMVRIDLADAASVQLSDPQLQAELDTALQLIAASRNRGTASLGFTFSGSGERRVRVGYVREVPVWKTSYRLVLDTEPLLQAWGIVENPSRQDWNDVSVSLVAGSPISFAMDLAEPLYIERPQVDVPRGRTVRPQQYEQELPRAAARSRAAAPEPSTRDFAGQAAEESARALEGFDFEGSVESAAETSTAGALFQYRIKEPVTIPAQQSAMLPILNQRIGAREVTVYDQSVLPNHPLRGVELTNSTGVHLMGGPVTVYRSDGYAGDALIGDVVPDSSQLLTYAVDLETEVATRRQSRPERITLAKITNGVLHVQRVLRREQVYEVAYRGSDDRTLVIEHPRSSGWELVRPASPSSQTRSAYRFEISLEPSRTGDSTGESPGESASDPEEPGSTRFEVAEERPLSETVQLLNLDRSRINFFLENAELDSRMRQALDRLRTMQQRLSELERQRDRLDSRVNEIFRDQERIRGNLERLDKDSDLYDRYIRRLTEQEDELSILREEAAGLEEEIAAQRSRIERFVEGLEIGT